MKHTRNGPTLKPKQEHKPTPGKTQETPAHKTTTPDTPVTKAPTTGTEATQAATAATCDGGSSSEDVCGGGQYCYNPNFPEYSYDDDGWAHHQVEPDENGSVTDSGCILGCD